MVGSASLNGSSPAKKYGITKPISFAGPTDADLQRNVELEKVILFYLSFLEVLIWNFVVFSFLCELVIV